MKICGKCGANNNDDSRFCTSCGAVLQSVNTGGQQQYGGQQKYGGPQQYSTPQPYGGGQQVIYTNVAPRSIPMAVVLSLVTCGIYLLYWLVKINDEINELAQDQKAPSGALVLVLVIVTCGIYTLYWYYKMGEKCDYIAQTRTSNNILYLVLGIFGLGIVSIALMQDTVNKVLE